MSLKNPVAFPKLPQPGPEVAKSLNDFFAICMTDIRSDPSPDFKLL